MQMKKIIPLIGFCLVGILASGMIATMKLPDLVKKAEFICIAKVAQISEIAVNKEQISTVKNVLLAEKILKGKWDSNEPIVFMTKQGGPPGAPGWIEDQVMFPPKGSLVLVFFSKSQDGSLETVNAIQGVWPLKDGIPQGMGLGTSIKQLEEVIKGQVE